MSRHVPRRDRWGSDGAGGYRSVDGLVVRRHRGEWWADVAYRVLSPEAGDELPAWEEHSDCLGPFKRPRNAMVEAERHAIALRNRHKERVRFEPEGLGEAQAARKNFRKKG